jgi:uncharacterized membrane protein YccC
MPLAPPAGRTREMGAVLRGVRPTWPRLRQAIQTASAAGLTYAIVVALGLPRGYWAVIASIIVVQASIGASLGIALDQLLATLLGAVAGAALVAAFGTTHWLTLAGLFPAIVALAYIASKRPSLRLAPVTAAIVVLGDPSLGEPLMSAVYRVIEIALGASVAVATTLLVFPSRAGNALAAHIGGMLPILAEHLAGTLDGALGPRRDENAMFALNRKMQSGFAAGDALAAEARRELAGHLADHADPAALLRTLRRLWHTALMAARACLAPLPAKAVERLRPSLTGLRDAACGCIAQLGKAYAAGTDPPDLAPVDAALAAFEGAVRDLRAEGIPRGMSTDEVAQLFTFAFALGHLGQNLKDLADRCHDLRRGRRAAGD